MDNLLTSDVCDEECDCLETDEEYEEDKGCEGHETLRGDLMGESFYCDGTCVNRTQWDGSPNKPQF